METVSSHGRMEPYSCAKVLVLGGLNSHSRPVEMPRTYTHVSYILSDSAFLLHHTRVDSKLIVLPGTYVLSCYSNLNAIKMMTMRQSWFSRAGHS